MELMKRLPEEIILEIFRRLPLISLLIFRCVSKSWRNQLDNNPEFVRMIENNFSILLIDDDKRVVSLDNNTLSCSLSDGIKGRVKKIHCPLVRLGWNLELTNFVGSCNGLLCMYDMDKERVCLWNPCTHEIKFVPESGFQSIQARNQGASMCIVNRAHGFVYDSKSDDYKYVHIYEDSYNITHNYGRGPEVQIYSFRTNTWKLINVPYSFCYVEDALKAPNGVLCNGALHWFVAGMLLALDITEEKAAREIPQPENRDDKKIKYVDVLDGCLCILYSSTFAGYEVWVMKDYGKKESWTLMYSISDLKLPDVKSFLYLKGIECLKTGEILLEVQYISFTKAALLLYDPKNGTTTVLKLRERNRYQSLFCRYVKSSVNLISESYTKENEQEQNDQQESLSLRDIPDGKEVVPAATRHRERARAAENDTTSCASSGYSSRIRELEQQVVDLKDIISEKDKETERIIREMAKENDRRFKEFEKRMMENVASLMPQRPLYRGATFDDNNEDIEKSDEEMGIQKVKSLDDIPRSIPMTSAQQVEKMCKFAALLGAEEGKRKIFGELNKKYKKTRQEREMEKLGWKGEHSNEQLGRGQRKSTKKK